ncbi:MAG: diacylglycerol kinase family lipid kinase [Candidatus Levybacteria bacterium]|nr:diacylglycerol kinase family lipid kinase [Candidatus Levybacteria bacterium]
MKKKYLLIYNPHSGDKKRIFSVTQKITLEDILALFKRNNITVDVAQTSHENHAEELTKNAIRQGYDVVIAAGGDGTIGEIANILVGTKTALGILPLGTYMNVARMLSIPTDLEKAIELIKKGNTRDVDAGAVTRLEGEKLREPYYFLESAGVGLEAEIHDHAQALEHGDLREIWKIIKTVKEYYSYPTKVIINNSETIETKATVITISNGSYTGPAINIAPQAKLDDHRLTVSLFTMSKFELIRFLLRVKTGSTAHSKHIQVYRAKEVKILTRKKRKVHADARLFGETPVEFKSKPKAITVITGAVSKDTFFINKNK